MQSRKLKVGCLLALAAVVVLLIGVTVTLWLFSSGFDESDDGLLDRCEDGDLYDCRELCSKLDLNLPRMDGREVLAEMKSDPALRRIPVVVLTSSKAEEDVVKSYDLHAAAYVTKPVDLEGFGQIVQGIESFWFSVVRYCPVP